MLLVSYRLVIQNVLLFGGKMCNIAKNISQNKTCSVIFGSTLNISSELLLSRTWCCRHLCQKIPLSSHGGWVTSFSCLPYGEQNYRHFDSHTTHVYLNFYKLNFFYVYFSPSLFIYYLLGSHNVQVYKQYKGKYRTLSASLLRC